MLPNAPIRKIITTAPVVINNSYKKPTITLLLDIVRKRSPAYRFNTKPLGDGIVKMALVKRLCEYFDVYLVDEDRRIPFFNLMEGVSVRPSATGEYDLRIRSSGNGKMHLITRLGQKYIPVINEKFGLDIDPVLDPLPPKFKLPKNNDYNWDVVISAKTSSTKQYEKFDEITKHLNSLGLTFKFIDDFQEFNLIQLAQVINQSKFYIGLDCGATHLAAACRKPGLVLFSTHFKKNKWHYPTLHEYLQFRPEKSYMTLDWKVVNHKLTQCLKNYSLI